MWMVGVEECETYLWVGKPVRGGGKVDQYFEFPLFKEKRVRRCSGGKRKKEKKK